jgi:hypothetical protein
MSAQLDAPRGGWVYEKQSGVLSSLRDELNGKFCVFGLMVMSLAGFPELELS